MMIIIIIVKREKKRHEHFRTSYRHLAIITIAHRVYVTAIITFTMIEITAYKLLLQANIRVS